MSGWVGGKKRLLGGPQSFNRSSCYELVAENHRDVTGADVIC